MSAEVLEEVRQTVAEVFGVDPGEVSAETSPESLPAWDSIGHLNLILAAEQRFGISFEPDKIPHLVSVRVLADAILAQQG